MEEQKKTNRLSIYLIKPEFNTPNSILKDISILEEYAFNEDISSVLYTKKTFVKKPDWIKDFFLKNSNIFNLKNATSQALFLRKVEIKPNEYRFFAIPFGVGHHLLKSGVVEERFGLKVVLNTVNEKQLRSIDKKNMSNVPKQSREQISINSIVADFGIDIEQDLIMGVTGKTKDEQFGKTITGKDSLKVSIKRDINTIDDFLTKCFDQYLKDDYKNNFGWIDQIEEIKSKIIIEKLNDKLIKKIKENNFQKLWMAVPEIIEWDDIEGFVYSYNKRAEKLDDIFIQNFLDGIFNNQDYSNVSIDTFKKKQILCYSAINDSIKYQWKAFNCLYCEIEDDDSIYLLTNGKWYEIQTDFVNQVNKEYNELLNKECDIVLPKYNHNNEGEYNIAVAQDDKFCLMDKKNISYGGGYSKIEFCDLYSNSKEIIHVKIYGGSSVLSHLFNQGLVSGELFKAEKEFRDKVNEKLDSEFKISNTKDVNSNDYKIIYAIISKVKKNLNIPFFSKVSLKNAKKRLETIGYNVFLIKILSEKK